MREELWQVDIFDGAEHQHVLVLVGELALERAGGRQHRLDGAHAVVVAEGKREGGGGTVYIYIYIYVYIYIYTYI